MKMYCICCFRCSGLLVSVSGFEGDERCRVRYMCETVGLTVTGHFSNHHDVLVCRKAEGFKYQKAREWKKPVVSLNWLAEVHFGYVNALQQMHHPKYQQFNSPTYQQDPFKIELKMAGSLLAAWCAPIKVTPDLVDKCKAAAAAAAATAAQMRRVKRAAAGSSSSDGVQSAAAVQSAAKKAKMDGASVQGGDRDAKSEKSASNLDAILDDVAKGGYDAEGKPRPMIRFSAMDAGHLAKTVLRLGGCLATNNKEATHLVMPHLSRTPKMLCCIPTVQFVLNLQWIKDSIDAGKLLGKTVFIFPFQMVNLIF